MCIIKVWCLPKCSQKKLRQTHVAIVASMERVPEFELYGEDSMIVLFPPDNMTYGLGSEILIEVTDLTEIRGYNGSLVSLREEVAKGLAVTLQKLFPSAKKVVCRVEPPFTSAITKTCYKPRMGRRRKPTSADM